jgi:hypothetical protein
MSQSDYYSKYSGQILNGTMGGYKSYIEDEYESLLGKLGVQSGNGWFPVKFLGWNDFALGSNNGALDMDGAGAVTHYIGFGARLPADQEAFLKEVMKATYIAGETGHKLNDPTAATPTGHA